MICLILAAGYATRLYPLTENFPKPLLEVGEKTILDWLIDDLEKTADVEEYIVVTNHRFANIFETWAEKHKENISVVDDNTSTNETRLGAVCDIQYAIDKKGIDDDLLVIAGDNLLDFSLGLFVSYAREKGASCSMRYYEKDLSKLQRSGVSEICENDRLISLEEKPKYPRSNYATPPFYYYVKDDIKRIKDAIASGCGTDAPGSLLSWMAENSIVYSMEMPGERYDIGNIESLEIARKTYMGIKGKIS